MRTPTGKKALDDRLAAATAYVTEEIWPPLPAAYGPWLVELAQLARDGTDPATEVPVPADVLGTDVIPPGTIRHPDGPPPVITLADALRALGQEDLLYPEDTEDAPPLEFVTPIVALALANTADIDYWNNAYDPIEADRLASELSRGEWTVHLDDPIRVDRQGRITSGLNELLAIVAADTQAPVNITYAYDNAPRPLTWRAPALYRMEDQP